MTDHPGFLADILDRPDDDTPRLIYADWLEDRGQSERAEFILVQVEHARIVAGGFAECGGFSWHSPDCVAGTTGRIACNRLRRLRERAGSLKGGPECRNCDWHAPIRHSDPFTWEYRRGFVHAVRCPLAAWEEHGPAVVSRHPVRRVEVTDWSPFRHDLRRRAWAMNADELPTWFLAWHHKRKGDGWWWHDTEEECRDVMSRELLAWARQQARTRSLWPGIPTKAEEG